MKSSLTNALDRLDDALSKLEGTAEARLEREEGLNEAAAEIQRMGADRARLAESLDNSESRAQRLESVNREVSRRLVDAMEAIRSVLDRESAK